MPRLLALSRCIDALNHRLSWITDWLVFLSRMVSAGNAFSRYAFSMSSNAWLEIQWYMFGAVVMLGASYTLKKNEHVRVDIFYARYPERAKAAIDLLAGLLALAIALLVIRYSIAYVQQSYAIGEISSDPGGLTHRWLLKALIPLGFALFALQALAQCVGAARRLLKPAAP